MDKNIAHCAGETTQGQNNINKETGVREGLEWEMVLPYRVMCLSTQFPSGDAVWEGYGPFRRWKLSGGRKSLGVGLKSHFLLAV